MASSYHAVKHKSHLFQYYMYLTSEQLFKQRVKAPWTSCLNNVIKDVKVRALAILRRNSFLHWLFCILSLYHLTNYLDCSGILFARLTFLHLLEVMLKGCSIMLIFKAINVQNVFGQL